MTRFIRLCALAAAIASPLLANPSLAGGPNYVNPQPLPPIHSDGRSQGATVRINVNPQPLPPIHPESRPGGPNTQVDVNPQPLPSRR